MPILIIHGQQCGLTRPQERIEALRGSSGSDYEYIFGYRILDRDEEDVAHNLNTLDEEPSNEWVQALGVRQKGEGKQDDENYRKSRLAMISALDVP